MKRLFTTILLAAIFSGVFGKTSQFADSVEICHRKYEIPAGSKLTAPNELTGPDYSISWEYVNEKKQEKLVNNTLSDISKQKNFRQADLECYFLFTEAKAYALTFDNNSGVPSGAIIIAATVKQQPVFIKITLTRANFTNEGLPLIISSLITLRL
ncbi:hypothetical protein KXQ82_07910 [Mucilaginibacter sp. HMF5004]|uniref:hypothetical protein n=1 Tax=Mucilaginibacter rivuli TaxID=2857527 RepID=UPI001C5CEA99|nr:hypothetical protein [Mucilaginibacter rivuli]MBW4889636.1 hypothetical protein [Mucilaginibacter rivuli]